MHDERVLLIVEDDAGFAQTLKRSFERRGYVVLVAATLEEMEQTMAARAPTHAVIDLKLGGASGLACVQALHERHPDLPIVVLTGYASIATAVEAIKLGACQYLAKPSNTDDIEAALQKLDGNPGVPVSSRPSTIKTLESELIHRTLAEADFNISETARRLGMHRRTLARKLDKKRLG